MEKKSDSNDFGQGLVGFARQAGVTILQTGDIHRAVSSVYRECSQKEKNIQWVGYLVDVSQTGWRQEKDNNYSSSH